VENHDPLVKRAGKSAALGCIKPGELITSSWLAPSSAPILNVLGDSTVSTVRMFDRTLLRHMPTPMWLVKLAMRKNESFSFSTIFTEGAKSIVASCREVTQALVSIGGFARITGLGVSRSYARIATLLRQY
jgi:hypothetical protein